MYVITYLCTEVRLERVLIAVSRGGSSGTLGVRGVSAVYWRGSGNEDSTAAASWKIFGKRCELRLSYGFITLGTGQASDVAVERQWRDDAVADSGVHTDARAWRAGWQKRG